MFTRLHLGAPRMRLPRMVTSGPVVVCLLSGRLGPIPRLATCERCEPLTCELDECNHPFSGGTVDIHTKYLSANRLIPGRSSGRSVIRFGAESGRPGGDLFGHQGLLSNVRSEILE